MKTPSRSEALIAETVQYIADNKDLQEADRARLLKQLEDEAATLKLYPSSGLYRNDGSTTPLWTIDWQYGPSYCIAPDGIHLVIYNDWAESMDNVPIRFYRNGDLLHQYSTNELVDFPDIINRGRSAPTSLDIESCSFSTGRVTLVSGHRERHVFDIYTGEIISSTRPPRWIVLGATTLLISIPIGIWLTRSQAKK